jgi:hypothetical protein
VPTISSTPVTNTGGTRVGTITAVDGSGPATVDLPATARQNAIVHARFGGAGAFIVTGVNAAGHATSVLAQSAGPYDGSFPVGLADPLANPTTGLHIATDGTWHLDIGQATLAPELTNPGVSGHGDAVLSYRGPRTTAHILYPGTSPFAVSVYANGAITRLASAVGPYDRTITLPAGPALYRSRPTGIGR